MNPRTLLPLIPLLVACGPDAPPDTPPPPPPGPVATTPAPTTTTTAAPPPTTTTTAAPPAFNAATVLGALMTARAKGMRAEGQPITTQLQEGGVYDHPITLAANGCYSVIAVGVGVTELDVNLVGQIGPMPEQVVAQDNDTGSQAVLGPDGKCFANLAPMAMPAKVRLRATKGSGQVHAQVLVK